MLGSLPGDASLAAGQYYAHPRNQFWALIGGVIACPDLPARPYAERLARLAEQGVGLWDVLASAHRPGSLDAAIRDGELAALAELAARLPQLRAIGFNGRRAAVLGRAALAGTAPVLIDLPSSSPAHAALSLADKQQHWLRLKEFLA